jgi:hypothetical protein
VGLWEGPLIVLQGLESAGADQLSMGWDGGGIEKDCGFLARTDV